MAQRGRRFPIGPRLCAVLGDFKVGKTFLINNLCNLNLASVESHHTKGTRLRSFLLRTCGHEVEGTA